MWTLLLATAVLSATPVVDVRTVDGATVRGPVVKLTSDTLVVSTGDGEKEFATRDLLGISTTAKQSVPNEKPSVVIELTDGSKLFATSFAAAGGNAVIESSSAGELNVSTKQINSVHWLDNETPEDQREHIELQWDEIQADEAAGDVIVIRKLRNTDKKARVSLDYLEGVLHDVTSDLVRFEFDGDTVDVRRPGKVEGIVYYNSTRDALPESICRISCVGGSTLLAKRLEFSPNDSSDQIIVSSPAGVKLTLPWDTIRSLDFSNGKIVYLSDVDPEKVEWTPFIASSSTSRLLSQLYQPRRDKSFDGGPLELNAPTTKARQAYDKGLAIHSRTRLVYRLSGKFNRFLAIAGIDARLNGQGNVTLKISGDGRELFESTVTGEDEPLGLDLNIEGVRRLEILVDFGDDLDIGDHLDLCDARVKK